MADTLNQTTIGGASPTYATFDLWEGATDNDLVSSTTIEEGRFRQADFDEVLNAAGATTSSSYFRILKPDSIDDRFTGTQASGARLRYSGSSFIVLGGFRGTALINEQYFVLDGLEIDCNAGSSDRISETHIGLWVNTNNCRVAHVGIYDTAYPSSSSNCRGINLGASVVGFVGHHLLIVNAGYAGFYQSGAQPGENWWVNLVVDGETAQDRNVGDAWSTGTHTLHLKNSVLGRTATSDIVYTVGGDGVVDADYCASEDASIDDQGGDGHLTSRTWATEFPSYASRIYTLGGSSTVKHNGLSPGSDTLHGAAYPGWAGGGALAPWTLDMNLVDHTTESGGWSMGLFAYDTGGGGGGSVHSQFDMRRRR